MCMVYLLIRYSNTNMDDRCKCYWYRKRNFRPLTIIKFQTIRPVVKQPDINNWILPKEMKHLGK